MKLELQCFIIQRKLNGLRNIPCHDHYITLHFERFFSAAVNDYQRQFCIGLLHDVLWMARKIKKDVYLIAKLTVCL